VKIPESRKELFSQLKNKACIALTPNNRLMRKLLTEYGTFMFDQGAQVWETPPILSMNGWLQEVWGELKDSAIESSVNKVIASDLQLTSIMTQIIAEDNNTLDVLSSHSLVAPALAAYKTLQLWDIDTFEELPSYSIETEQYQVWHKSFKDELSLRHLVTLEESVQIITESIIEQQYKLPKNMTRISFDEIPPLFQRLYEAIEEAGTVISDFSETGRPSSLVKIGLQDREEQHNTIALWAKNILELKPNSKIGIVCPELPKHRSSIQSALTKKLEPQARLASTPRYTLPFNFSAGISLSEVPVISAALKYLTIGDRNSTIPEVSAVIRSPYISGSLSECTARTFFDLRLRDRHSNIINFDDLLNISGCPVKLAKVIGSFLKTITNTPQKQKPSQWAYLFNDALDNIGWPGERNLDSEEYQCITHWHEQLEKLSSLDSVVGECSKQFAFALLQQCVVNTIFQPETADSPIQVLGLLEAAGLNFDYLWIMDFNDDIWPLAPQPNPFIPLNSQKQLGMPHASAERELEFSKRIFDTLKSGANDIVISYLKWDADKELRCSMLAEQIIEVEVGDLNLGECKDYVDLLKGSFELTDIPDKAAPVSSPSNIRGGTSILSTQAQCPFKAFAEFRLKSKEFPEITIGLDSRDKGKLIHSVLEHMWNHLKTQKALLELRDDEQVHLIDEALDMAFFYLTSKRKNVGERLIKLERQRIKTVISQWLKIEKNRIPFKVIECEKRVSTNIAGLPVTIVKDRVDEVNGGRFLIDYKTGNTSISSWAGERLEQPQLPIYLLADNDICNGVAFGQVRRGDCALKGISDDTEIAPGIVSAEKVKVDLPHSWLQIKERWTQQLDSLAGEFLNGIADVSPKSPSSCRYCHLESLCRKS